MNRLHLQPVADLLLGGALNRARADIPDDRQHGDGDRQDTQKDRGSKACVFSNFISVLG